MLRDFQMIGRIGKIDEIQLRKEGSRGCEVRIACSDFKKGEETTSWFTVTCFGKSAETVLDVYNTGDQIFVSGSIDMDTWQDKQTGKDRFKMRLKAFRTRRLAKGKSSREGEQADAPKPDGGYAEQFDAAPQHGGGNYYGGRG